MIYIGKLKLYEVKNGVIKLKIPFYHRAATGMLGKSELYAVPKINSKENVTDIIFSPINPQHWKSLWFCEIISKDRKGLIRDLTEIFSLHGINILMHDFINANSVGKFHLKLLIDIYSFCQLDSRVHEEKIRREQLHVLVEQLKELNKQNNDLTNGFSENERDVEVAFEPNHFLGLNYLRKGDANNEIPDPRRQQLLIGEPNIKINKKHQITLSTRLVEDLHLNQKTSVYGFIMTDTEEKFMRLRFFSDDCIIITIEISHENTPGAIYSFTDYILKIGKNQFNIVACYNRVEAKRSTCRWYATIDITKNPEAILKFRKKKNWEDHAKEKNFPLKISEVRIDDFPKSLTKRYPRLKREIYKNLFRKYASRVYSRVWYIALALVIFFLILYTAYLKGYINDFSTLLNVYGLVVTVSGAVGPIFSLIVIILKSIEKDDQ